MQNGKPPKDLLPGDIRDYLRSEDGLTTVATKITPQMKAHVLDAIHKEGWTLSIAEWMRHAIAGRVAETLGMPLEEVLEGNPQPRAAKLKGSRWVRVE